MNKSTMTVKEFAEKWMPNVDHKLRTKMIHDLEKVIALHRNPLITGITNAIFELEQGFTAVPVGEG